MHHEVAPAQGDPAHDLLPALGVDMFRSQLEHLERHYESCAKELPRWVQGAQAGAAARRNHVSTTSRLPHHDRRADPRGLRVSRHLLSDRQHTGRPLLLLVAGHAGDPQPGRSGLGADAAQDWPRPGPGRDSEPRPRDLTPGDREPPRQRARRGLGPTPRDCGAPRRDRARAARRVHELVGAAAFGVEFHTVATTAPADP